MPLELTNKQRDTCFDEATKEVGANARGEVFLNAYERIAAAILSGERGNTKRKPKSQKKPGRMHPCDGRRFETSIQ
jgi:hypothetical protein